MKTNIGIVQKEFKIITTDSPVWYYLYPKYNFALIWLIRVLWMKQISACSGTYHPIIVFLRTVLKMSQTELMSWVVFRVREGCKGREKKRETNLLPEFPD